MSGVIECTTCGSMSAHPEHTTRAQRLSFASPDMWEEEFLVEYACSNCPAEFSVIVSNTDTEERDCYSYMEMAMSDTSWTYPTPENSMTASSYRGIGFRGKSSYSNFTIGPSKVDSIALNRRRKTAGIDDIKSASKSTQECEEYSLTQIDLEL